MSETHSIGHAQNNTQKKNSSQDMTSLRIIRGLLIFTTIACAVSMFIYVNEIEAWSRRNLYHLLAGSFSALLSVVFFGLCFKKEQTKASLGVPVVFDLISAIVLLISTIMVTAMYAEINHYGFCSARVYVYSYNYYINCRGLMSSIIFGYSSFLLFLASIAIGVKSALSLRKKE